MFRRRADEPVTPATTDTTVNLGKGRATPTRREAEAARKAARTGSGDPKAQRKAERDRARTDRLRSRQALMEGDERALPARDRGTVRKTARDMVDSRRSIAELFVPTAIVVVVVGFIGGAVAVIFYYLWLLILVGFIVDGVIITRKLRRQVRAKEPETKVRGGDIFYALMRSLTLRRLRLPPPRFKPGGAPVQPKAPKQKAA